MPFFSSRKILCIDFIYLWALPDDWWDMKNVEIIKSFIGWPCVSKACQFHKLSLKIYTYMLLHYADVKYFFSWIYAQKYFMFTYFLTRSLDTFHIFFTYNSKIFTRFWKNRSSLPRGSEIAFRRVTRRARVQFPALGQFPARAWWNFSFSLR